MPPPCSPAKGRDPYTGDASKQWAHIGRVAIVKGSWILSSVRAMNCDKNFRSMLRMDDAATRRLSLVKTMPGLRWSASSTSWLLREAAASIDVDDAGAGAGA